MAIMCGIAGWYRRDGRPVPAEVTASQCDAIAHRGPDDFGYFSDGDLGMGMRRLSIIDIAGGHQPMESEDRRYVCVFNGEIYNHLELRPGLEARGATFKTHSDTETLLAAFTCWRDDVWLKLEGMYAAAIWDRMTRTLTFARDPLGIKPLYITGQHGGFAFASELKSLTLLPEHRFDVDERAVHDFFRFGHVQRPRSIYRQVRQLEPGHFMHIPASGDPAMRRFWKPRIDARPGLSETEWIEETRLRVLDTVKRHLLSDVPVGAFLSSGVDSSAVTAAMAMQTSAPVTAFTIGHPGNPIDESAAAGEIAAHLGCHHVVLPVDLMEARDLLPVVQRCFDEPTGASSAIPTWYLSRLAAEHVKVVLCGDGGDELFTGYKRQRKAQRLDRWRPLARAIGPALALIGGPPAAYSGKSHSLRQRLRRYGEMAMLRDGFQRFVAGTQISSPRLRARLYEPAFYERQERPLEAFVAEYFDDPEWRDLTMLEQFMLGDLTVHMPSALLGRLDRASMAHSLEARVPLLSHRFVDWALTVPIDMKMRGPGKYVLREAVRPWLPQGILERRKQGFQMPLDDWFAGDYSDFARAAWRDSGAADAGFLRADAVDRLFAEHRSGRANYGKLLFAITMFACWWQHGRIGTVRNRLP
jgi:asparagine synthase (glutamine-hydrolysing)